jgi:lipid-binding SYLF domain-containing protein
MKLKPSYLLTALMAAGIITGCKSTSQNRDELTPKAQEAKAEFLKSDTSLKPVFDKAAGYVIFPSVAKGALGVGAATGTGQVYEKDKAVGQAAMTQVTVGFQAGGQAYSELILFEDQTALDNFKKGNFELSAQASAVAVTAGAAANAKYEKGLMVLTMAKGGLMYEASVGGQKFSYTPY